MAATIGSERRGNAPRRPRALTRGLGLDGPGAQPQKQDEVPKKGTGRRPMNQRTTKIRLPGAAFEAAGSAVEYPDGGVSREHRRARRSAPGRGTERDRPDALHYRFRKGFRSVD